MAKDTLSEVIMIRATAHQGRSKCFEPKCASHEARNSGDNAVSETRQAFFMTLLLFLFYLQRAGVVFFADILMPPAAKGLPPF